MSLATTAEGAGRPGSASWAPLQVSSMTPRQGSFTIEKAGSDCSESVDVASASIAMASRVALLSLQEEASASERKHTYVRYWRPEGVQPDGYTGCLLWLREMTHACIRIAGLSLYVLSPSQAATAGSHAKVCR